VARRIVTVAPREARPLRPTGDRIAICRPRKRSPCLLVVCSAAPVPPVSARHNAAGNRDEVRTDRHRLTARALIRYQSSGLLIRGSTSLRVSAAHAAPAAVRRHGGTSNRLRGSSKRSSVCSRTSVSASRSTAGLRPVHSRYVKSPSEVDGRPVRRGRCIALLGCDSLAHRDNVASPSVTPA
jgi:hypothetical protein